jgi:hypothetical protein
MPRPNPRLAPVTIAVEPVRVLWNSVIPGQIRSSSDIHRVVLDEFESLRVSVLMK